MILNTHVRLYPLRGKLITTCTCDGSLVNPPAGVVNIFSSPFPHESTFQNQLFAPPPPVNVNSTRHFESAGPSASVNRIPRSVFAENSARYLEKAPVVLPVEAPQNGHLATCDARGVGMAVIALGGGRSHPDDKIDHRVGFSDLRPRGAELEKGEPFAAVHAADQASAEAARQRLLSVYTFSEETPPMRPVILSRIS